MTEIPAHMLERAKAAQKKIDGQNKPADDTEASTEKEEAMPDESGAKNNDPLAAIVTSARGIARMIRERTEEALTNALASADDALGRAEEMARQTWGIVDEAVAEETVAADQQEDPAEKQVALKDILHIAVRDSAKGEPFVMNVRFDGKKLDIDVAMPNGADKASESVTQLFNDVAEALKQQGRPLRTLSIAELNALADALLARPKRPSLFDSKTFDKEFEKLSFDDPFFEQLGRTLRRTGKSNPNKS